MDNIYYKVLDKDMTSPYQQFHYELGKTYTTDKELELCEYGFHACKNMCYLLIWNGGYYIKDCRFFKCNLGDKVIEEGNKVCSNSITLVEEIPFEVVNKDIKDNIDILLNDEKYSLDYKIMMINQGYGLDILVNDEDEDIRAMVADRGYGLDILVNDESFFVRREVAKQGYGLDILINDEDEDIRVEVAKQGYGLDILVNDKDSYVRKEVADQGYGLDILVNDKDQFIRAAVARQGYGLDKLINDESWIVRAEVAKHGYGLDILVNDENILVRKEVSLTMRNCFELNTFTDEEDSII